MARFVLTAQLQLQAPTNTRQVVGEIRNQLAGQAIRVPVEVQGARQAQTAVQDVTNEVRKATNAADALGRSFGLAIKRFAAFTVASRAVSLFTNSLAGAVDEAIQFQREVIKIAQVTGASDNTLKGLTKTITDLSTGLGVVSSELLAVTRILSQAGVRGRDLEVALESLAKSTLAPTFDDITQTAEGAVAILAQFQKGAGALESQLGSINAVAGAFAVESGDLIGAVRRFGGVFKSAGGSLEELLAIFTSVRQTTRESAESISTGLRTIFTRIQRPETIRFLKQLGVELQDTEGRFVGPIEAVEKLGKKFADLEQGDLQFIRIAEELGGFRQIGKVIPLIQQYEVSLEALKVAQDGQGSLADDTAKAQEALAVQITKVKQDFLALVRSIAESTSFQLFTRTALELASALIKIADAVKPLLPLLGGLAAIKFTRGLGGFFAGAGASIRGLQGRNAGGKILGFARGGFVPGTGNRDTVPAMLQPGEFVIKKSSAQKLGADTLKAMNENRYSDGGGVVRVKAKNNDAFGAFTILDEGLVAPDGKTLSNTAADTLRPKVDALVQQSNPQDLQGLEVPLDLDPTDLYKGNSKFKPKGAFAKYVRRNKSAPWYEDFVKEGNSLSDPEKRKEAEEGFAESLKESKRQGLEKIKSTVNQKDKDYSISLQGPFKARQIGGPPADLEKGFAGEIKSAADSVLNSGVEAIAESELVKNLDLVPIDTKEGRLFDFSKFQEGARETVEGYLLEGITGALTNAEIGGGGTNFDFPNIARAGVQKEQLAKLYPGDENFIKNLVAADAKRQKKTAESGDGALFNKVAKDKRLEIALANKGGSIAGDTDTVPALLTPGEFVVNKKAAQSIGYGNLNTMNKKGVAKFAQGGAVGIQRFQGGGDVGGGGGGIGFNPLAIAASATVAQTAITELGDTSADASDTVAAWSIGLEKGVSAILSLVAIGFAVKATIDWTKSLRESIKAQDEAKAAAQAAKEGKTDGTTDAANAPSKQSSRPEELKPLEGKAEFDGATGANTLKLEQERLGKITEQVNVKEAEVAANKAALDAARIAEGEAKAIADLAGKEVAAQQKRLLTSEQLRDDLEARRAQQGQLGDEISDRSGSVGDQATASTKARIAEKQDEIVQIKASKEGVAASTFGGEVSVESQRLEKELQAAEAELKAMNDSLEGLRDEALANDSELSSLNQEYERNQQIIAQQEQELRDVAEELENNADAAERYNKAQRDAEKATKETAQATKKSNKSQSRLASLRDKEANSQKLVKAAADRATAERTLYGVQKRLVVGTKNIAVATGKAVASGVRQVAQTEKARAAINALNIGWSSTKRAIGAVQSGLSKFDKNFLGLRKAFSDASRGAKKLAASVKGIAARGLDAGKRGFAAAGRGLAVGGGIVAAVASLGKQIAAGFEQWFKRAEEIARKNDDIAGAIEAAGNASLAGSAGEAFTLTGFAEIAADSIDGAFGTNIGGGNGKQSFVERAFQKRETAQFEAAQSFIAPRLQAQLDALDPTLGASQEDRDNAARGTIEAFARTRSELSDLAPEQRDKALLAFNKQARDAIKSLDGAGVSIDELRSTAINLTGTDRKLRESLLKQVAAIEESRKVQAELNKANLQSLQITSAFGAANAAVANFAAGLETGSSTLGGYINTLEQAQSGVGIDASAAIDAIEKDLVGSATAAGADVLADDIRGQADVARASTGFAAAAGGAVENLRLSANNPEAARAKLEERLRQAIPQGTSREVKEQIGNVISQNVKALGDDLSEVDLSDVVTKISKDSQALAKGFFEAAKLQDQHNQAITKLYQQREQIEAKVAESLNKAIDVQLEAAKNFESFGGARLTVDQQLSARIAQFNNVGGLAGVGLRTGSAQDIKRVAAEIGNVFNNSQQTFINDIVDRSTRGGGPGVFAGPGGFQKDQRPEAQRSNDQLLRFTQQRIQLLKEELKIVKAKNQEEKNALDKLISGDIEGFIKGQAAAGAGAALRSGSSRLTSLFSASALGAGFKSLEGQGLTDAQKGRAEQLTLERFGLQSQGILSGTTAEERELNAQGRELSQLEGQLGAQAAQFAKSEIAVNEATIIATKLTFQNELQNVARRNANFVAPPPPQVNRWMGGPIYANRGMFVPRGTDTVPAMLTPGEFVVNRSAVQRGNNLQILRAMNSQGGASSPNAKSGGGRVYYNTGGVVEGISSAFQDSLPALRNVFDGFSQAVDRLANTQFSVKLDTTNVNVNLNGASFLATMKEDIKRELLDEVSREIGKAKPNSNGDMELRNTVL